MRSAWSKASSWAYGLEDRRRWQIWLLLAAVGATLLSVLPSPWSWVAAVPIAATGIVLFDAKARRDRDETSRRAGRGR